MAKRGAIPEKDPMTAGKRNRGWLWYFLILAGLTVLAVVFLIWYNLSQQLRPEELAAARQRWQAKGLRDYRLTYTIKRGEGAADSVVVVVRGGKTVSAAVNGRPEPAERLHFYGMDRLFDDIERFLDMDKAPGKRRTYARARFADADGHLEWYVRRVMEGRERLEITVESFGPPQTPVDAEGK